MAQNNAIETGVESKNDEGNWSGGWSNAQGDCTFPYKDDEEPIHHAMDYSSNRVNQEVA